MTTLTWLGEDHLYPEGQAGPSFVKWNGITFRLGVPVPVTDPDMIRRAKGNRFYRVEGESPVVEISYSGDGGSGWSEPIQRKLGPQPPISDVQPKRRGRPPKPKEPSEKAVAA